MTSELDSIRTSLQKVQDIFFFVGGYDNFTLVWNRMLGVCRWHPRRTNDHRSALWLPASVNAKCVTHLQHDSWAPLRNLSSGWAPQRTTGSLRMNIDSRLTRLPRVLPSLLLRPLGDIHPNNHDHCKTALPTDIYEEIKAYMVLPSSCRSEHAPWSLSERTVTFPWWFRSLDHDTNRNSVVQPDSPRRERICPTTSIFDRFTIGTLPITPVKLCRLEQIHTVLRPL